MVHGPAGIGKTTLVREVLRRHPHVEGPALEGLRWKPYAPLSIALGVDLAGDPESVASSVSRNLGRRILFVDDLQWADDSTKATLGLLAGRVPLIVTARSKGIELPWSVYTATVELGPLPRAVCRSLVEEWHPELAPEDRERLVQVAGGSPLLLQHLVLDGQTSPTLRAAAQARLAALPDAVAAAVTELALVGRPVSPDVLDVAPEALPPELVEVADGRIALRHRLLGEAALATLDDAATAAAHRRLARRLPAVDAAAHHLASGDVWDALCAAQRALDATTDSVERARLLLVAARASGEDHRRVAAAEALVRIGDWAGAQEIAATVTDKDPMLAAEAAYHLARARWFAGDVEGARAAIHEGLRHVEGTGAPIEVRLLIEEANQRVRVEEATQATTPIAVRALAAAIGTGVEIPRARMVLATALAHDGRPGWEEAFREAVAVAADAGDGESECAAGYFLASHLGFAGRATEAIELLDRMIARAEELGLGTWRTHMEAAALTDRFLAGFSPSRLVADSTAFIDAHPLFRNRAQADLVLALSLADEERHEEARRYVEARLAECTTSDDRSILLTVSAELAWLRGDHEAARSNAEAALALGSGWFGITAGAAAAAALARFESNDRAIPEPPPPGKVPTFQGFIIETEALRRWSESRFDLAIEQLDVLAARWAAVGTARYELRTRWLAGVVAMRAGEPSARRRLVAVRDAAVERGIMPIARRAEAALAEARPEPLTPREAEVMALVAEGCSSEAIAGRMGIARTTVESHVRAAMRKLGVTTRRQAVSALHAAPRP